MKRERGHILLIITAFVIVVSGVILMTSINQFPLKVQGTTKNIDNGSNNYYFRVIPPPIPFHDTFTTALSDTKVNYKEPNCIGNQTVVPANFSDTKDAYGNINRTYTNMNYDFSAHCDVDKEQVEAFQGLRFGQLMTFVANIPDTKFTSSAYAKESRGFLTQQLNYSLYYLLNEHPNTSMKILNDTKNFVNGVQVKGRCDLKTCPGYIEDVFVRNETVTQINGLENMVYSSSSITSVPEYGPVAVLVFTMAIAFIILVSTKFLIHEKKIP